MSFYGLIEKAEFNEIIEDAKKLHLKSAIKKLKSFDSMNEQFFSAAMPDDTQKIVVKKRINKLKLKKQEKELKRLLG